MKRVLMLIVVLLTVLSPLSAFAEYEKVVPCEDVPYQWCLKDGYWYFCNADGAAFPGYRWTDEDFNWLSCDMFYKELPGGNIALCFGSTSQGKWGVIDASGNILIEPVYDYMNEFADGNLLVGIGGKFGVIDMSGATVIEPIYDEINYHKEYTLHPFRLDGKCGFMDDSGRHAIDAQYDDVCLMSVWAWVRVGEEYGMIDPEGDFIFEPQFDFVPSISEKYALVEKDRKTGVAAPDGSFILEPVFDAIWGFTESGISAACLDGLYGYIRFDGTWFIEPQFEEVSAFTDGYAIVKTSGLYGIIDSACKYLIEPVWEDIHSSANCDVSKFGAWEYTEEKYHAVQGDREYYFDIIDGKIVPGGEDEAWE